MTLTASYNAAFITANGGTAASAETALLNSLNAGTAYLNIHTTQVPGGEIRGFLQAAPAVAPEPVSLTIWGLGALGCAVVGCRRRKLA
jgi:hypothetical protein